MGTTYQVRVVLPPSQAALAERARCAVDGALQGVDRRMSTYRDDSEISTLNRLGAQQPLALSSDTMQVLSIASAVSRASDGAFDVTAGRLVNAWGFGPHKHHRLVDPRELQALKATVGHEALQLDVRQGTACKMHPALYTDLSAIAKGFGVDQAARALDALGVDHYLIEVGGEVRTRGLRADGRAWQVGIEHPEPSTPRRARYALALSGMAMATSGDYRLCFESEGRRYSHEIDPRTGLPINNGLTSVSVVAPECAVADAYATALIVLGPQRGYALAERLQLAACFILRTPEGRLQDRFTSAFAALGGQPLPMAPATLSRYPRAGERGPVSHAAHRSQAGGTWQGALV